jgi:hypothetical protein
MSGKPNLLLMGLFFSAMAARATGQQTTPGSDGYRHGPPTASAPPQATPQADYLKTEVRIGDDAIYVDNDFRIYSGDGWSFIPVTFLYLDKDKTLRRTEDQDFRVEWSMVIPPEEYVATWRDTSIKFGKDELAGAFNLPKGKRTVLWVVPALWRIEPKEYMNFGWDAAAPLAVTTDAEGKIAALETFPTRPRRLESNDSSQTLDGKECKLETKLIHLSPDAKLVKNSYGFQLVGPTEQIGLQEPGRGAFFGAIDSPEKARELFEVALGGSKIIKDRKQYEAIAEPGVAAFGRYKVFWRNGDAVKCGYTVKEVAGIGYHIEALVLDCSIESGKFTGVSQYDTYIRNNGVMTERGWSDGCPAVEFDKMVRPLLKDEWLETVPKRVTVTEKKVTTPTLQNRPPPTGAGAPPAAGG